MVADTKAPKPSATRLREEVRHQIQPASQGRCWSFLADHRCGAIQQSIATRA